MVFLSYQHIYNCVGKKNGVPLKVTYLLQCGSDKRMVFLSKIDISNSVGVIKRIVLLSKQQIFNSTGHIKEWFSPLS